MSVVWSFRVLSLAFFLSSVSCLLVDRPGYIVVNTTYGAIRGKAENVRNTTVAKFLGIPYAKPPLGSLRFKAPQAPDKWDNVKKALLFSSECLQFTDTTARFENGDVPPTWSEDCLYLNVYSPSRADNQGALLPVMVWIHGGGYVIGSGSQYDGTFLATEGVVMVTINYRLDIFGFLSLEDDVLPGNYGMLDQIAALKWVQDNIVAFGGDRNQVTIFGESAGASSVSLLTLSPLARGLFHRAIMQSGVAIAAWATDHPVNKVSPRMEARLVSQMAKCNQIDNSVQVLTCLQQVDADRLLNVSITIDRALAASTGWKPRVETTFGFLPDLPINLFSKGEVNDVDTIRGFNSNEMDNFMAYIQTTGTREATKASVSSALESFLTPYTELEKRIMLDIMEPLVFTPPPVSNEQMRQRAADVSNDLFVIAPTIKELELLLETSNTGKKHFLYEFNHRASFKDKVYPAWINAVHGDEIPFVFGIEQKQFAESQRDGPPDAVDIDVSKKMMDLWTNFAKYGDPTPSHKLCAHVWPAYRLDMANFLPLNNVSTSQVWSKPQVVNFYERIIERIDGITYDDENIVG